MSTFWKAVEDPMIRRGTWISETNFVPIAEGLIRSGRFSEENDRGPVEWGMFRFMDATNHHCSATHWSEVRTRHLQFNAFQAVVDSIIRFYKDECGFTNRSTWEEVRDRTMLTILPHLSTMDCMIAWKCRNTRNVVRYNATIIKELERLRRFAMVLFLNSEICIENLVSMDLHAVLIPLDVFYSSDEEGFSLKTVGG